MLTRSARAGGGEHAYVIAPEGLGVGDVLSTKRDAPVKPGMTKPLRSLPSSTVVHNVELRPGLGAQICRSAGASATLIKNNDDGTTLLALPSGACLLFSQFDAR